MNGVMRWIGLWTVLLVATGRVASAADEPPLLTIDPGGHTDSLTALIATGPEELITASFDKTIRVWDLSTGETRKIIRGEAGIGSRGEVRSLALSPDRRMLLAGGCFDNVEAGRHPIRVYAWPSGKLRGLLQAHDRPVNALAIHPNGLLMASGDQGGAVRLWRKKNGTFEHVAGFRGHTRNVVAVAFAPQGKDLLVSAGQDGNVCYWEAKDGTFKLVRKVKPLRFGRLTALAFHPNGQRMAVAGTDVMMSGSDVLGEVAILDRAGKTVGKTIPFAPGTNSLTFSPDGRKLAVGCGYPSTDCRAFVLSFPEPKLLAQFRGHDSTVGRITFLPDGRTIASAGGQDNRVLLWDAETNAPRQTLTGKTRGIWNVGVSRDGRKILWGDGLYDPTAIFGLEKYNDRGPLSFGLDLDGPELVKAEGIEAVRGTIEEGTDRLELRQGETYQFIRLAGRETEVGLRRDGDVIFGATFLPESKSGGNGSRVMIAGTRGLGVFDPVDGRMHRELIGHTSAVYSVAPFPSGEFAVSGGGDQTVKLWHLPTGRLLLNIFKAGNDWVAWTPQGYYAASPQGDRLIGWQVNHGEGRDPEHFVASQFSKTFFRPDVIRLLLKTGSVEKAVQLADAARGREAQRISLEAALPPEVKIVAPESVSTTIEKDTLVIRATATSRGTQPVTAMQLLLEGRPYLGRIGRFRFDKPKLGEVSAEWTVTLTKGTHRISVQAESAVSKAVSSEVEIRYGDAAAEPELPGLYVLAIGIGAYADPELRLAYAARDAQAIAATLRAQSGAVYREVETQVVTDGDATGRGIRGGLSWLRGRMSQRDVGVVFFSGHGETDLDGNLYLLPVDADKADPVGTGVSGEQIKQVLAGAPGRLVVMLDACHAGAIGTRENRSTSLTDGLVRDLVTDDYGVVVMCSSMGREFSLESHEHRQGYFTLALLEGLRGKADYNKDASIVTNELDLYVSERVGELTKGRQTPVTAKPASVRPFVLARLEQHASK